MVVTAKDVDREREILTRAEFLVSVGERLCSHSLQPHALRT